MAAPLNGIVPKIFNEKAILAFGSDKAISFFNGECAYIKKNNCPRLVSKIKKRGGPHKHGSKIKH